MLSKNFYVIIDSRTEAKMKPENFDAAKIKDLLSARGAADVRVYTFETVGSTNDTAKEYISRRESAFPAVFAADSQTGGRGRMGRSFFSPHGGLYMTLAVKFSCALNSHITSLTSAAAVASALSVEEICGIRTGIKWVNDLYTGRGKVCGILCETLTGADGGIFALAGIGINLADPAFPEEISGRAAGLGIGKTVKNALAAAIAGRMLEYIAHIERGETGAFMELYRRYSVTLGQKVIYTRDGVEYEGTAVSVDDLGRLTVRRADGMEELLATGEISLRIADRLI